MTTLELAQETPNCSVVKPWDTDHSQNKKTLAEGTFTILKPRRMQIAIYFSAAILRSQEISSILRSQENRLQVWLKNDFLKGRELKWKTESKLNRQILKITKDNFKSAKHRQWHEKLNEGLSSSDRAEDRARWIQGNYWARGPEKPKPWERIAYI